jgi:sulfur relay protein TusB/DsrH
MRRSSDDLIVLLGDGVYTIMLEQHDDSMHAIQQDIEVRGIANIAEVKIISYAELVELCALHSPIVSWND